MNPTFLEELESRANPLSVCEQFQIDFLYAAQLHTGKKLGRVHPRHYFERLEKLGWSHDEMQDLADRVVQMHVSPFCPEKRKEVLS